MYTDSQSDNENSSENELMRPDPDAHYLGEADSTDEREAMPLVLVEDSWTTRTPPKMERDACRSAAVRATRRLRMMAALLVALAILGIALFGSSSGQVAERSVAKVVPFDVNAPPGIEERVYRKQVHAPIHGGRIADKHIRLEDNTTNKLPFPVIHADDDVIPQMVEKAVDALECRESVINFVINATDAKDECNGLKKAFDMTCNSDSAQEIKASADPEHSSERRRRLLLAKKLQKPSLTLRLYQMTRSLRNFAKRHLFPSHDELFFPEDEIMGDAWVEAKYQVLNDYDNEVHESLRRKLEADMRHRFIVTRMRFLEETKPQANSTENQTAVSKPAEKKVSLSMPTNKLHASDQMLSDTLMLGKEKDIQAAIKASANMTNTTLTAAQEDAVASSKAVHDTAAAVSALLNDPESVEARTCCASILNVYHEHCDTTEGNDLSDSNLFLIVFIIAFCGVVKSLIRHFRIRWLPEAAGCILVGGK